MHYVRTCIYPTVKYVYIHVHVCNMLCVHLHTHKGSNYIISQTNWITWDALNKFNCCHWTTVYRTSHTSHTTSHDSFSLYFILEISVSMVLEQELHHSSTTTISCSVKWRGSVL